MKKLIFSVLAVYGLMGLYVNTLPGHERYPFYAWNLFSSAPLTEKADFIRVKRYGTKHYDTLLYGDSIANFVKVDYKPDFFWQVQKMRGDNLVRKNIEDKFLARPVEYQLVETEYNPLELIKKGKIISERIIYETQLY